MSALATPAAPPSTDLRDVEIAVIGAGFAGLGMAIRLKQAGHASFVVIERAADVGGTWRDNDYPGCACDVPSMLYSFSFEENPNWTRVFPPQAEIWEYLRRCVDKYGLRSHLRFNTELSEARYDEADGKWTIETTGGARFRARVVISAMGPLNRPHLPEIPGLDRFAGVAFHSSQWDHSFDVRGKRIACVGTGASAIQFVPAIAPLARQLTVFQRSAAWIIPKPDGPIGRVRRLLRRLPGYTFAMRSFIYWALEIRALGFTVDPSLLRKRENDALKHLHHQVKDPDLVRKLTPDYRMGCKRVLISNDFYPAMTRPNVDLVTTPIRELREHSIVTEDGVERPIDAVIYGTGFLAADASWPVRIVGRGGLELGDAWKGGMEAYLGTSVAGFPNLFFVIGPNTGLGHNSMIFMMESHFRYILDALALMRDRGLREIDVRHDVQRAFNEALQRRMARTVWATGCRSWYMDKTGKNTTLWPGFTFVFRWLTRKFRPERYIATPATATTQR